MKRKDFITNVNGFISAGLCPIITGHTGWGKTQSLYELGDLLNLPTKLIQTPLLKSGDLLIPYVDKSGGSVKEGLRSVIKEAVDKPFIICFDEIFKADSEVILELAEILYKKRIGEFNLHPECIIFGTSNLEDEGFGDKIPEFIRDRVIILSIEKPTNEEWVNEYARPGGLHPVIIQSSLDNPQWFEDYRNIEAGSNKFIYDPRCPVKAFVTGRTLEFCSNLLYQVESGLLNKEILNEALSCKIGELASYEIISRFNEWELIPPIKPILDGDSEFNLPESPLVQALVAEKLIFSINKENYKNVFKFVLNNFQNELRALFYSGFVNKVSNLNNKNDFLQILTSEEFKELKNKIEGEFKNE